MPSHHNHYYYFITTITKQKYINWNRFQLSYKIGNCLLPYIIDVFHRRSSFFKGHFPSKVLFHRKSSCTKGCLPSGPLLWKVIFHGRLSSMKGLSDFQIYLIFKYFWLSNISDYQIYLIIIYFRLSNISDFLIYLIIKYFWFYFQIFNTS